MLLRGGVGGVTPCIVPTTERVQWGNLIWYWSTRMARCRGGQPHSLTRAVFQMLPLSCKLQPKSSWFSIWELTFVILRRFLARVDDAPLIRQASSPHETRIGPSSGQDSAQTWRLPATLIGIQQFIHPSICLHIHPFMHVFFPIHLSSPHSTIFVHPSIVTHSPILLFPYTKPSIHPSIHIHPFIHPPIYSSFQKSLLNAYVQCWLWKYYQHNLPKDKAMFIDSHGKGGPTSTELCRVGKAKSEFIENWKCGKARLGLDKDWTTRASGLGMAETARQGFF